MSDDTHDSDADIIRAAYAEKVKEAFKVFAENLGMGQNQQNSKERFLRSLELVRKARDMALDAAGGAPIVEPTAQVADGEPAAAAVRQRGVDDLSAEDQAIVEQALAGTTGQKSPLRRR
jgi:hypothetical protein